MFPLQPAPETWVRMVSQEEDGGFGEGPNAGLRYPSCGGQSSLPCRPTRGAPALPLETLETLAALGEAKPFGERLTC